MTDTKKQDGSDSLHELVGNKCICWLAKNIKHS